MQSVDRALLVDTLSTAQQASANAWAARMGGIGGVVGYFVYVTTIRNSPCPRIQISLSGNVDLVKILPILGNEQLQVLSALAAVVMISTHVATALLVRERVLLTAS